MKSFFIHLARFGGVYIIVIGLYLAMMHEVYVSKGWWGIASVHLIVALILWVVKGPTSFTRSNS